MKMRFLEWILERQCFFCIALVYICDFTSPFWLPSELTWNKKAVVTLKIIIYIHNYLMYNYLYTSLIFLDPKNYLYTSLIYYYCYFLSFIIPKWSSLWINCFLILFYKLPYFFYANKYNGYLSNVWLSSFWKCVSSHVRDVYVHVFVCDVMCCSYVSTCMCVHVCVHVWMRLCVHVCGVVGCVCRVVVVV